jgi:ABC-2 type transport system ATP-binding protein
MITINQVSKSYNGQAAVKDLSIQIKEGEIYGLLGPNGAGKSTTLNMLLGFIKADSGSVSIADSDPATQSAQSRKVCGYIPENVNLYNELSGLENLDYFCQLAGIAYSQEELKDILATCGLQPEAHQKRVGSYSKGMRQKVGIAIAYAKKAKVYLLDEPASGLDPSAANELSSLLKKLAAEGATILMASHDIFRVRETCDRIGILKNGQLVKEMQAEGVSANELEQLYLNFMHN